MDHEDRLKQNLQVLMVDNLSSLRLEELIEEIDNKFPKNENLSTKRLLHIYIAWLNERLTFIDNSDEEAVREEIYDWVEFLRQCHVSDPSLYEHFKAWTTDHLKVEPTSLRRLDLARIELEKILDLKAEDFYVGQENDGPTTYVGTRVNFLQLSVFHQPVNEPLPNTEQTGNQEDIRTRDHHRGAINPDRSRQSLGDDGMRVEDHHQGMHPDRLRHSLGNKEAKVADHHRGMYHDRSRQSLGNKKADVAENPQGMYPYRYRESLQGEENDVKDGQSDTEVPSFLTGANLMAYLEQEKRGPRQTSELKERVATSNMKDIKGLSRTNPAKLGSSGAPRPASKQARKGSDFRGTRGSGISKKGKKGVGRYFCGRCRGHDHPQDKCPCIFDPSYDMPPADKDYLCLHCGKMGDHYASVCHKNPGENSIYQRRLRAGIYSITTGPENPEPRGRGRLDQYYDDEYKRDQDRDHEKYHDDEYERDRDRDYDHNDEQDDDGDYDQDYEQPYDREHDRGRYRDYSQGHDKNHSRPDDRRPRQRSRSQELPRRSRGQHGGRSRSPTTLRREKRHHKGIDRYVSARQDFHRSSRRSRSPGKSRNKSSRVARSPLGDRFGSRRSPKAERGAVSKVRDREHTEDKHQYIDLEGRYHEDDQEDQFWDRDGLPASSLNILGHSKRSLYHSDDCETEDNDVVMAEFPDQMDFNIPPEWEVFFLPRDEFLIALDEFISDIASTVLPSYETTGKMALDHVEEPGPEPMDVWQPTEKIQPAMALTAASLGLLAAAAAPVGKQNDNLGLDKFSELSLVEKDREKSPPIELGVAVKAIDCPPYTQEVLELMGKLKKKNVWVNKTQRNRARDFLTMAPRARKLRNMPDLDEVTEPEIDEHETGSEFGVKQEPEESLRLGAPVSYDQQDIAMTYDGIAHAAEANLPVSTEGVANTDHMGVHEHEVNFLTSTEDQVMAEAVISQEHVGDISAATDVHIETGSMMAMATEHEVTIATSFEDAEVEAVGNDSLVSNSTEGTA